jgi:hypothetical protein
MAKGLPFLPFKSLFNSAKKTASLSSVSTTLRAFLGTMRWFVVAFFGGRNHRPCLRPFLWSSRLLSSLLIQRWLLACALSRGHRSRSLWPLVSLQRCLPRRAHGSLTSSLDDSRPRGASRARPTSRGRPFFYCHILRVLLVATVATIALVVIIIVIVDVVFAALVASCCCDCRSRAWLTNSSLLARVSGRSPPWRPTLQKIS